MKLKSIIVLSILLSTVSFSSTLAVESDALFGSRAYQEPPLGERDQGLPTTKVLEFLDFTGIASAACLDRAFYASTKQDSKILLVMGTGWFSRDKHDFGHYQQGAERFLYPVLQSAIRTIPDCIQAITLLVKQIWLSPRESNLPMAAQPDEWSYLNGDCARRTLLPLIETLLCSPEILPFQIQSLKLQRALAIGPRRGCVSVDWGGNRWFIPEHKWPTQDMALSHIYREIAHDSNTTRGDKIRAKFEYAKLSSSGNILEVPLSPQDVFAIFSEVSSSPETTPETRAEANLFRVQWRFANKIGNDLLPLGKALDLLKKMGISDALKAIDEINGMDDLVLLERISKLDGISDELRNKVTRRLPTLEWWKKQGY
jgi:hypothetical protein